MRIIISQCRGWLKNSCCEGTRAYRHCHIERAVSGRCSVVGPLCKLVVTYHCRQSRYLSVIMSHECRTVWMTMVCVEATEGGGGGGLSACIHDCVCTCVDHSSMCSKCGLTRWNPLNSQTQHSFRTVSMVTCVDCPLFACKRLSHICPCMVIVVTLKLRQM